MDFLQEETMHPIIFFYLKMTSKNQFATNRFALVKQLKTRLYLERLILGFPKALSLLRLLYFRFLRFLLVMEIVLAYKKFSFPKIRFEPMFLTGSLAVFIGAAPPHFQNFAGAFPRPALFAKRAGRNAFGLF